MRRMWLRSVIYVVIGLALVFAAGNLTSSPSSQAWAGGFRRRAASPQFENQYAPAAGPGSVAAALYPSPRPVPPLVGNTYITYQPLAPQAFMYHHHDVYRTEQPGASRTRTSVRIR